jgi:hypothetical protein
MAVAAIAVIAWISLRLSAGQGGPPVVTTPNDNSDTNDAPEFETMLSAGDATLMVGHGTAYWCTTSACADGPSLAAWTSSPFVSVAGGVLPDGEPVLAGLTEVHGNVLRLNLLSCTRRACTVTGGGVFTAPDFNPDGGLNDVYAASESSAGFAVAFGDDVSGAESLYVVVCDSARCDHPSATRLAGAFESVRAEPGVSNVAVAAAQHGGFSAAAPDPQDDQIDVYECAAAPCRTVTRQQVSAQVTGPVAITVTSGQTLLAYDTSALAGSQVVLASAAPGQSFSQLATVNAPVAAISSDDPSSAAPAPAPAIIFGGSDLMVVSEDASGHTVTLTTCSDASCGTAEVIPVASVGHLIVDLGIGVPAGNLRILWATQDTDFLGGTHYSGHLWVGNDLYPSVHPFADYRLGLNQPEAVSETPPRNWASAAACC